MNKKIGMDSGIYPEQGQVILGLTLKDLGLTFVVISMLFWLVHKRVTSTWNPTSRRSSGVERFLGKEEVTSSNLVVGSIKAYNCTLI